MQVHTTALVGRRRGEGEGSHHTEIKAMATAVERGEQTGDASATSGAKRKEQQCRVRPTRSTSLDDGTRGAGRTGDGARQPDWHRRLVKR